MPAKYASSLDALPGGRVRLGIGAGWYEEESRGLGIPYPPLAERFERLEETLRILDQMFEGDPAPFEGEHYRLERPVNDPAPVRRPPIMVGGAGEGKTLRVVAQYDDACKLFERVEEGHKLQVLGEHGAQLDRSCDAIVETTAGPIDEDRNLDKGAHPRRCCKACPLERRSAREPLERSFAPVAGLPGARHGLGGAISIAYRIDSESLCSAYRSRPTWVDVPPAMSPTPAAGHVLGCGGLADCETDLSFDGDRVRRTQ